ncbi:hypothetical protein [Ruminococcus sp.]|uniref:hypothetical protein n=1 Tax=Ruminococcus sp. TaxID=41978 RepID=UPI0025D78151|nr:hypothetical protein [Ruminococcus sp.]
MYYKIFSKTTHKFESDIINKFDLWLASLAEKGGRNITASRVASELNIDFGTASDLLVFSEQQEILNRVYIIRCPECDFIIERIPENVFYDPDTNILDKKHFCNSCGEYYNVDEEDVYIAYDIAKMPDNAVYINEAPHNEKNKGNFTQADSLTNIEHLYKIFFAPGESAYNELLSMMQRLDGPFEHTTEQGHALDYLVMKLMGYIRTCMCSTEIRTSTNQIDCSVIIGLTVSYPSVFDHLKPNFIIECKNEKETPDIGYFSKLEDLVINSDSKVGILWTRKKASKNFFEKSYHTYLRSEAIIINMFDDDLYELLVKRRNLLDYLSFKIFQVTHNSFDSNFEMFHKNSE